MKLLMLILLTGLSTAQAAEPTGTLMLACQGTRTHTDMDTNVDEKPEPISMGVTVNFTARTVEFGHDAMPKFPMQVSDITETTIGFGGTKRTAIYSYSIIGTIERVTGTLEAIFG